MSSPGTAPPTNRPYRRSVLGSEDRVPCADSRCGRSGTCRGRAPARAVEVAGSNPFEMDTVGMLRSSGNALATRSTASGVFITIALARRQGRAHACALASPMQGRWIDHHFVKRPWVKQIGDPRFSGTRVAMPQTLRCRTAASGRTEGQSSPPDRVPWSHPCSTTSESTRSGRRSQRLTAAVRPSRVTVPGRRRGDLCFRRDVVRKASCPPASICFAPFPGRQDDRLVPVVRGIVRIASTLNTAAADRRKVIREKENSGHAGGSSVAPSTAITRHWCSLASGLGRATQRWYNE